MNWRDAVGEKYKILIANTAFIWYNDKNPINMCLSDQKSRQYLMRKIKKGADFMVIVNTDYITGQQLQTISIVRGSVVMTKHLGSDIGASFKTLIGGEIKAYTDMLNNAREIATARMMEDAARFGADAVINVRYTTSSVMQGASEILAVGTAVRFVR